LRTLPLLFGLTGVLLTSRLPAQSAAPPAAKKPTAGSIIWAGRAAGVHYRWTDQDLTATVGAQGNPALSLVRAKPAFSLARELKREFGKPDTDDVLTFYEVGFQPLSAVGSLLSYERDDYWDGGAHPSGVESFVTVDVRSPGRHLKLTDIFDAAQIRQALLSDPIVQHVLTREKIAPPPTLDGLVKALANKLFGGERDGMYSIPESLLSDFAFHHIEQGKVAVRLLLPHGSEIFRFHHTQLALLLPLPAARQADFTRAATGEAGAMMPALQRAGRGHKSALVVIQQRPARK
jgi:hypothetical protein